MHAHQLLIRHGTRWMFSFSFLIVALFSSPIISSPQAATPRVAITNAPGFTITWDGNDGGFSNPNSGAGPSHNVALANNGTVPFTSSDLARFLVFPFMRRQLE